MSGPRVGPALPSGKQVLRRRQDVRVARLHDDGLAVGGHELAGAELNVGPEDDLGGVALLDVRVVGRVDKAEACETEF